MDELKRIEWEEIVVGERLGPVTVDVSQEDVGEYLRRVTDANPWYRDNSPFGGPIAPPTFVGGNYGRLLRTKYSLLDGVHTGASHTYANPVKVGDTLTIKGSIVDKYIRRGRSYIVLESVTTNQNGQAVTANRDVLLVNASKKWPEDTKS